MTTSTQFQASAGPSPEQQATDSIASGPFSEVRASEQPPALDYATPMPRRKYAPSPEANRMFWTGVQKLVFAGGIGMVAWGLTCLMAGVDRYSAPLAIGWGVTIIILMLPFPLRRGSASGAGARASKRRAPARV